MMIVALIAWVACLVWVVWKGSDLVKAGVAALGLVAAVVLGVGGMKMLGWGRLGWDVTQDRRHEMAEGTRRCLEEVKIPVVVRMYRSGEGEGIAREWKEHCQRVEDLLAEMVARNPQWLKLEIVEPEPGEEGEEAAVLDGMRSRVGGEKELWCGVVVSGLDRKRVMPLVTPEGYGWLEGDLVRAVREVSREREHVVGLLSRFDLSGQDAGGGAGTGLGLGSGWLLRSQLKKSYDVRDLAWGEPGIPRDVEVLLVLHPAGISAEWEREIEEFLGRGGKLVGCLDGYSVISAMLREEAPLGQKSRQPAAFSGFPRLLEAWGIGFEPGKVVADGEFASVVGGGEKNAALMSVSAKAMLPGAENSGVGDLYLVFSGRFDCAKAKVAVTPLVRMGEGAYLQDWDKADQGVERKPDDAAAGGAVVALRIEGELPGAFGGEAAGEAGGGSVKGREEGSAKESAKGSAGGLTGAGQRVARVWLVGDADMFGNDYAYDVERVGEYPVAARINSGNIPWLMNIIDVACGADYVLGGDNRNTRRRTLERFEAIARRHRESTQADVQELQRHVVEATRELVAARTAEQGLGKTGEDSRNRSAELADKIRGINRQIRERQKAYREERDRTKAWIMAANIAIVPALVVGAGVIVTWRRRRRVRKA